MASLTPSNTEILAFLDRLDALVARDRFSDWPPGIEQVASVGPDLQIDVDELARLEPDLVLAAESVPGMEQVNEQVDEAGLPRMTLAPTSLDDILDDVHRVGEAMAVPERAHALVDAMRGGLREIRGSLGEPEPVTVYWEWWPDPAIAPGGGGWMDEVIERAGGRNVFADADAQSLEVDLGEVQAADPDAVGLCWQGTLHAKQSAERFCQRDDRAWGGLRAAREGRVHPFPEALYGRPGPRIVEGVRRLAATLHPDRAQRLPDPYAWVPDDLKGKLPLSGP